MRVLNSRLIGRPKEIFAGGAPLPARFSSATSVSADTLGSLSLSHRTLMIRPDEFIVRCQHFLDDRCARQHVLPHQRGRAGP